MERRITSTELQDSLGELLDLTTMTVATSGPGGEPHAAAVYFAPDDQLNLYFFSDASSQHALDAAQDDRAAVTIHPEQSRWQEIHGMQMRGSIRVVQSQEQWQEGWKVYLAKFPFVAELEQLIANNQMHKFSPHWIRLVDNRQGFGYKQEWGRSSGGGEDEIWDLLPGINPVSDETNG